MFVSKADEVNLMLLGKAPLTLEIELLFLSTTN